MRSITSGLVRILVVAMLGVSLSAQSSPSRGRRPGTPAQPSQQPDADETRKLHKIFDDEWEYGLAQGPLGASSLGDRRWNDKWPDISLENIERQRQHSIGLKKELAGIDRSKLGHQDQVSYDMFVHDNDEGLEEFEFKSYLIPVYQREGIQLLDGFFQDLRYETAKDYEDYLTRLNTFSQYMDQTIALMREGMRLHIMHPKVIMQRIPAQIDRQLVAPEESGFYVPFKKFPASFSEADKQRFNAAGKKAIEEKVLPEYRKFKDFFVKEYLPASEDQVGVWQWPNGDKYYAFTVRKYTTTNMTPDQVYDLGLAEVKRIHAEMEKVKEEAGFKGSMEEFFHFLRTDPQFFYKNPDDLLEAYRATAKKIDPQLVRFFKTLPRATYGVAPIPMTSAPDTTAAYYSPLAADGSRAGTFSVNLYKPDSRPKWEMMALALHESVPGHHLQIARSYEIGDLPKFRRYGYYSAFGEGWGLYAESLGDEMGLYDNPYSKFGYLTYQMWRAVRLVVDTGMHYKHWTRQQAIDYFMQNAAKTETDVVNEIDRYIAWPGQALAYKIGELKIKSLREKATKELGEKFDLKEFHNVVIDSGAIPLDLLEKQVDEWIAEKKGAGGSR